MIKILHISTAISWRGGERQILNLVLGLNVKKVFQIVLCPETSILAHHCVDKNINTVYLKKNGGFSYTWSSKIIEICKEEKITTIHVHDSKSHTYVIVSAFFYKQMPSIFVSRRVIFPIKTNLFSKIKYKNKKIKCIICISKAVENEVLKSLPAANTSIIYSSIDSKKYLQNDKDKIKSLRNQYDIPIKHKLICYVAALTNEKDHFTFIKTAEVLLKNNENYTFFIVGDGNLKENIENEIKTRNLERSIILTGFVQDINSLIQNFDLLLFTSLSEGLGSTVLDFFHYKIPVVSTRNGGVEELIIQGETGLLSNKMDFIDLAANVEKIFSDSLFREKITKQAYQLLINNFQVETMVNKTLCIYEKYNDGKISSNQKITVIIPTYNEENNIEACIQSVLFANEILIVDSFSKDQTLEIARKYPVKIIQREYENSASQKNWAIPQASNEWVLLVDADERVTPELEDEIKKVLDLNPKEVGFWIYRKNFFMGRHMKHSGLDTDKVIRLFLRDHCSYMTKNVHSEIVTDGKVGFLKGKLTHNTYKTFDNYIAKKNRYAWWSAGDHFEKNSKIGFNQLFLKPAFRFFKHFVIQFGFLDGIPGVAYAFIESYGVFTRYLKIWLIKKNLK